MRGPLDDLSRKEEQFLRLFRLKTGWYGQGGIHRLRLWLMDFGRPVPKDGADRSPKGFTGGKKVLSGDGSPQD
jgi:hypothetical protein